MTVYSAGNPGIYPLDPTSDVGKFRLASSDTQSTPYDPIQAGFQDYQFNSDVEIEQFLSMGNGSINGGMGYWYLALAGQAALQSKTVKDFDLSLDLTKRSADLRAQAAFYFDQAAVVDGSGEYFDIVPTGHSVFHQAELSEHRVWCP